MNINDRENRFNNDIYSMKWLNFKKNPKPLWQIAIVTLIMCINGIVFASVYTIGEDFRAIIIFFWSVICISSILNQACYYCNHWIMITDIFFVILLMGTFAIIFIPTATVILWIVAILAIVVFSIMEYYKYQKTTTVLEVIWLVNAWHFMVILTTVLLYTLSND